VLDAFDDFPIHQAPVSVAHTPLGANAYDRYFFNGYADDGSIFFAVAMGLYPNRGVLDGAVSVVRDGRQQSVYVSRRAPRDRRETAAGPLRLEVVEPMTEHRIVLDHDRIGVDLRFRARTAAVEEPRFTQHNGPLGTFDYTRFTQFGTWSGTVRVDGEDIDVTGVLGCRDRSWGERRVGGGHDGAPVPPQFAWLWAPINFPDGAAHFDVNDHADGSRWHESGFLVPLLGQDTSPWSATAEPMRTVDYRLTLEPGTRWARSATVLLRPWRGETVTIELEPVLRFQMHGLGYGSPEFRMGSFRSEEAVDHRAWLLDQVDPARPENLHVQQLVRARTDGRPDGLGVLEVLLLGPHDPTGLQGLLDPA
jgi:hypothetical protein